MLFKKFWVRTDNSALTFLHSMKLNRGVYSCWYKIISSFDYNIIHCPGRMKIFADALSRMGCTDAGTPEETQNFFNTREVKTNIARIRKIGTMGNIPLDLLVIAEAK